MLTASQLRANIYRLLDHVLETGKPLRLTRKGQTLVISSESPPSRLARLPHRHDYVLCDPEELIDLDWSGEWSP